MDWNDVVPASELNYIMGNPPFVGAKLASKDQREDKSLMFGSKISGKLDYVCCWFKKATDFMLLNNKVRGALVSTNSVCQGEIATLLWKELMKFGIKIDFAYRTFKWDSEANLKAHVHCVIIGFSLNNVHTDKYIYNENIKQKVEIINQYLIPSAPIFVEKRQKNLFNLPEMTKGSQLIDNGNFVFTKDEMELFIKKYPESSEFFYEYLNADSFLNSRETTYCICLKNCPQSIKVNCKGIADIIKNVYEYRINSNAISTKKLAATPSDFFITNIPKGNSMLVPVVSSEQRRYIPIGFVKEKVIYSNASNYIDNASMFYFGLLISIVHMAWMRAVAGRLESRYRYSKDIVYNNFPCPKATEEQINKIEKTAQMILDSRSLYSDCSLSTLYKDISMPHELRKAHQENDKAVLALYGFKPEATEEEIVAKLMQMYAEKVKEIS